MACVGKASLTCAPSHSHWTLTYDIASDTSHSHSFVKLRLSSSVTGMQQRWWRQSHTPGRGVSWKLSGLIWTPRCTISTVCWLTLSKAWSLYTWRDTTLQSNFTFYTHDVIKHCGQLCCLFTPVVHVVLLLKRIIETEVFYFYEKVFYAMLNNSTWFNQTFSGIPTGVHNFLPGHTLYLCHNFICPED